MFSKIMTVKECLNKAYDILKNASIECYEYDAQELLSNIIGIPRLKMSLNKDLKLDAQNTAKFFKLVDTRATHIPLQHIFNHSDFYGLDLYIDSNVLIPRFETEILCEYAIKTIGNQTARVLDLCTGSGCIAISIAKHCCNATVDAIDISKSALDIAKINAKKNNVSINFIQNNLLDNITLKYDFIISNPPYISSMGLDMLPIEVKHDPIIALDGGIDGMDIIKNIIFSKNINKNTTLMLELGHNQAHKVSQLMLPYYNSIKIIKDYSDIDRFIIAERG